MTRQDPSNSIVYFDGRFEYVTETRAEALGASYGGPPVSLHSVWETSTEGVPAYTIQALTILSPITAIHDPKDLSPND